MSFPPATDEDGPVAFAAAPDAKIAGLKLVRVDLTMRFQLVTEQPAVALSGGGDLTLWYAYGDPWERLWSRSSQTKAGVSAYQIHVPVPVGGTAAECIRLITESGVAAAAAEQPALALGVVDDQGDRRLSIVRMIDS